MGEIGCGLKFNSSTSTFLIPNHHNIDRKVFNLSERASVSYSYVFVSVLRADFDNVAVVTQQTSTMAAAAEEAERMALFLLNSKYNLGGQILDASPAWV